MPRIQRSATVPHSPEAMFDLVNDVESYPKFLPWCRSARVLDQGDGWLRARIDMARGALHHAFTTCNYLERGRRIRVELERGPFRHLEGDWHFEPTADGGCRVSLDLEFEFAGRVLSAMVGPIFNQIASTLVDSFCRRARDLYGRR
ncbi:MAG: type II toxin-antitoxin system RatA family toxin [Halofilum sp. (in: g-proteobacteria)]|nr:type II toxin-antitoxin system RatA family toxin [Halofilum sp. (in: g-proteobacteria)]